VTKGISFLLSDMGIVVMGGGEGGGDGAGAGATAANRLTVINCHLTWLRAGTRSDPSPAKFVSLPMLIPMSGLMAKTMLTPISLRA